MTSILLALGDSPAQNLSIFHPSSSSTEAIRTLSILLLAISAFILVIVEAVLIYSILRFRHRGTTPGASEPPQVYGSQPIEIAWTAAPTLVVFVIVLVTARTLWEVEPKPPEPKAGDKALFVTVIGRQWWWEYVYETYDGQPLGFITANELHIPAGDALTGRPVHLKLQSADVCHSFWVPRLTGKMDLIPGRTNHLWFQTQDTGVFLGQCAEYCGTQHAGMLLRVVVQKPTDFAAWVENQQKPAVDDPEVRAGRDLFLGQSCANCHRIRGTSAVGTYAPDLTHLMSRQTLAAGVAQNNPADLRPWVADPQKIKPGCLMPAFGLSNQNVDLVVRYLQTLR